MRGCPWNCPPTELLPHSSGGVPNITDAAFSVIVVFYVSVTFCFVYFAFCFYNTAPRSGRLSLKIN